MLRASILFCGIFACCSSLKLLSNWEEEEVTGKVQNHVACKKPQMAPVAEPTAGAIGETANQAVGKKCEVAGLDKNDFVTNINATISLNMANLQFQAPYEMVPSKTPTTCDDACATTNFLDGGISLMDILEVGAGGGAANVQAEGAMFAKSSATMPASTGLVLPADYLADAAAFKALKATGVPNAGGLWYSKDCDGTSVSSNDCAGGTLCAMAWTIYKCATDGCKGTVANAAINDKLNKLYGLPKVTKCRASKKFPEGYLECMASVCGGKYTFDDETCGTVLTPGNLAATPTPDMGSGLPAQFFGTKDWYVKTTKKGGVAKKYSETRCEIIPGVGRAISVIR